MLAMILFIIAISEEPSRPDQSMTQRVLTFEHARDAISLQTGLVYRYGVVGSLDGSQDSVFRLGVYVIAASGELSVNIPGVECVIEYIDEPLSAYDLQTAAKEHSWEGVMQLQPKGYE
ncbi:MAG: hypothetical protein H6765_08670 [Candidatus Peribacteria bacterium]|nr:MAG: hypothetical protein H6765_08670 [Candidatus Peribacteria bacterium]